MNTVSTERRLRNWKELVNIADGLIDASVSKVHKSGYHFRGHAVHNWELTPTLLRNIDDLNNKSVDEILEIESFVFEEFVSQAHLYLHQNEYSKTNNALAWWTVMQHYGAPTRLLDWTQSLFVAAYFAVNDHLDEDGAIWAINCASLHKIMSDTYGNNLQPNAKLEVVKYFNNMAPYNLHFIDRPVKSERMIAQQGSFCISHNVKTHHGDVIHDKLKPDESSDLSPYMKLIIPAEQKLKYAKRLRNMNITASSLFPGLDGLGRSIREIIQLS